MMFTFIRLPIFHFSVVKTLAVQRNATCSIAAPLAAWPGSAL